MAVQRKIKIYLGDLVHSWGKVGLWTFPLNIGYVASFAQKVVGSHVEVKLFKDPEVMIERIKQDPPAIVALSYYVWNFELNNRIFEIAKSCSSEILTVGGGPRFTNVNTTEEDALVFMAEQPYCDAFIYNQGERGFAALVERFIGAKQSIQRFFDAELPGSILFPRAVDRRPVVGPPVDPVGDLDEIPSPYLKGMMDEFFDGPYSPIIETNRSCPYRCTFCSWGIGTQKLARFSLERVLAEIEYISERCTRAVNIYIGDANFGILERDAEIAAKLRECSKTFGFPGHVSAQWNKTRPDRVLAAARELGGLGEVGASMQSLNTETLKGVKRKNLPLDKVMEIRDGLRDSGITMPLVTELILGLPEETAQSHIDANKTFIDLGAEIFNYNLHLLPGTEMYTREGRDKFIRATGWRLQDNAFGIYDGKIVVEGQEVVLETSTMKREELRSFRLIHFLLQFMWGRKWYFDVLKYLSSIGIHPMDMILSIAQAMQTNEGEIGQVYAEFRRDHDLENFGTLDELKAYWSAPENFARLKSGEYGKLNYVFTFKILLEHAQEFDEIVLDQAHDLARGSKNIDIAKFTEICGEIVRFNKELRIAFSDTLEFAERKDLKFLYDILGWKEANYARPIKKAVPGDAFWYLFAVSKEQKQLLEKQLVLFDASNRNLMFRQMSVDTSPDQFFYTASSVASVPSKGLSA
jgi:radical SAM superfamily enzyme YgiQ (UPF0313 family)